MEAGAQGAGFDLGTEAESGQGKATKQGERASGIESDDFIGLVSSTRRRPQPKGGANLEDTGGFHGG